MNITKASLVNNGTGGKSLYIHAESLFDRWELEKWISEMVPNVRVFNDDTVKAMFENELIIQGDMVDLARIKLVC